MSGNPEVELIDLSARWRAAFPTSTAYVHGWDGVDNVWIACREHGQHRVRTSRVSSWPACARYDKPEVGA